MKERVFRAICCIDGRVVSEEHPTPPPRSGPMPTTTGGGFVAPTAEELQAQLPGYEITELIAAGGMGAVYKARQPRLARTVAIKVLPVGASASGAMNFAERFEREAKAMAKMHHSRIVGVHDFGETGDGHSYIVMEFVEGTDLHRLIRAGTLTQRQILAIITQVCDALHYAHGLGIVHRDVKPANIMLDVEGQVKVADFGLAKLTGADAAAQMQLTMTNVAMGTPDYVAPEQLEMGREADGRADIYSLGVMIYEMLTGKVPRGAFKWPSEVNAEVDPRMDAVVEKAMQSDRDSRYQSVAELWAEVDEIGSTPAPASAPGGGRAKLEETGRLLIKPGDGATRKVTVKPATALGEKKTGLSPGVIAAGVAGAVLVLGVIAALVFSGGGAKKERQPAVAAAPSPAQASAPKAMPLIEETKAKAKAALKGPSPPLAAPAKNAEAGVPALAFAGILEAGGRVDLISLVDIAQDAAGTEWSLEGGQLSMEGVQRGGHRLVFPVSLVGRDGERPDYAFEFGITRTAGRGVLRLHFPVAADYAALLLDLTTKEQVFVSGLEGVRVLKGINSGSNPTRREGEQLPLGQEQRFRVAVKHGEAREVAIEVRKAGGEFIRWEGETRGPQDPPGEPDFESARQNRQFYLRSAGTKFRFSEMKLDVLSGTAGLLRAAPEFTVPGSSLSAEATKDRGFTVEDKVAPVPKVGKAPMTEKFAETRAAAGEKKEALPDVAELREREASYRKLVAEKFAELREFYKGAVGRELEAAAKAADLPGAAALKAESARLEKGDPLPEEDAADLPTRLAKLRDTLRTEQAKIEGSLRAELETSLKALEVELTKAKRIEDAIAVKKYREGLGEGKPRIDTLLRPRSGSHKAGAERRDEAEPAGGGINGHESAGDGAGIGEGESKANEGASAPVVAEANGGRLRGFGRNADGTSTANMNNAEGIGDFVRVKVNEGGGWAALRANGTLESSQANADGVEGVIDFDIGFEAGLILKANGEVVAYGAAQQNMPKNLRGIVDVGWAAHYGFAVRGDGKVEAWTNTDETAKERAARMFSEELENVAAVECASRRAVFRLKDGTVRVFGDYGPEGPRFRPGFEGITEVAEAVIGKEGMVALLTREGKVICRRPDQEKNQLPPALQERRFTTIRAGTSIFTARRADGIWAAWAETAGEFEEAIEKVRSLGAVTDVAVWTPSDPEGPWDWIVYWIE